MAPTQKPPQAPGSPTQRFGTWGEEVAVNYLTAKGYAITAQQWKMGHLELDIVAQDGACIVFVEVKTRKNPAVDPVEAVSSRKRSRMIQAADVFLKFYNIPFEFRFDIISISGTKESYQIEHIPDAFFPSIKR